MRPGLVAALTLSFASSAGTAAALSCAPPGWETASASAIVPGEATSVRELRRYERTPWAQTKPVRVRELAADIWVLRPLKGAVATPRLTYLFRDKKIDCDFGLSLRPGERAVFAVHRTPGQPDQVSAISEAHWRRVQAAPQR
jgi:hypothetical protein